MGEPKIRVGLEQFFDSAQGGVHAAFRNFLQAFDEYCFRSAPGQLRNDRMVACQCAGGREDKPHYYGHRRS